MRKFFNASTRCPWQNLPHTRPHDDHGQLVYDQLGLAGASAPARSVNLSLADYVKRLAQAPLVYQPGTVWDYSLSIDVLGRLVEVVSGQALDVFFADRIFKPLRMDDTGFYVPQDKLNRLATLYNRNADGTIIRAGNADQEGARKKPAVRLLSPKTVTLMRSDVLGDIPKLDASGIPPKGYGFGLTFAVNRGPDQTGSIASRGEYFWGGAAGTVFWIDPAERMTGVWMMQTMNDLTTGLLFKQLAYQAIETSAQ